MRERVGGVDVVLARACRADPSVAVVVTGIRVVTTRRRPRRRGRAPPSASAERVSIGAGLSGSEPSAFAGSIQRLTSPSEYVCTALNSSESTSSGERADRDREALELARLDRPAGPRDRRDGLGDRRRRRRSAGGERRLRAPRRSSPARARPARWRWGGRWGTAPRACGAGASSLLFGHLERQRRVAAGSRLVRRDHDVSRRRPGERHAECGEQRPAAARRRTARREVG